MFARFAVVLIVLGVAFPASAQVRVDGYFKKDGTYVQPHYRSAPDGDPTNNYSTKGNVNPFTGKAGTVEPNPLQSRTPSYGQPLLNPPSAYSPYGRPLR